jgi:hypothetical protein
MASPDWDRFFETNPPKSAMVVYPLDAAGEELDFDPALQAALAKTGAPAIYTWIADSSEPFQTVILARGAVTAENLRDAFEYAMQHVAAFTAVVIAAEGASEAAIPPSPRHVVRSFPPESGISYWMVSEHDPGPENELQRALTAYFVWVQAERRPKIPTFFPGRPRANEAFVILAQRAPIEPASARPLAREVAEDMFQGQAEVEHAIDVMVRAFQGSQPRELISSSLDPESYPSDLFGDDPVPSKLDVEEEEEEEEEPPPELYDFFDTPLPPGVEMGPETVFYHEYDLKITEEIDEDTNEKYFVVDRENCRQVRSRVLVATEDLDPEVWRAKVGGKPIIAPTAIARYEADTTKIGTSFADIEVGGRLYETVIVDQTGHWSAAMAHAPLATLEPPAKKFERAFANASVDDDGNITLLRPVKADEMITIDYGDEFFTDQRATGSGSFGHFRLELVDDLPETRDEIEELESAMIKYVWRATAAEKLGYVEKFARLAASYLIISEDDPLPFSLCDATADLTGKEASDELASAKRIFARVLNLKNEMLKSVVASFVNVDRAGDFIAELETKKISSTDPAELWDAAKAEWLMLDKYMEAARNQDTVLFWELKIIVDVMEREAARVMSPDYNEFRDVREPQLGRDFVLPYPFEAVRKIAMQRRSDQVEKWKQLFRDAGVDPEQTMSWEVASVEAASREARIAAVTDETARRKLREFVDFWRVYPEFTVVGPGGDRELKFTADQLLKVRKEEERQRVQAERDKELLERKETLEAFDEEEEERRELRAKEASERQAVREANEFEFGRLGDVILALRGEEGETFDPRDLTKVRRLISVIESSYKWFAMEVRRNKTKQRVWEAWKRFAESAYTRVGAEGYDATSKFHKFVERAVKILKTLEEYEILKHPKRHRKALERLGYQPPPKKKRRAKKPDSPVKKKPPTPPRPPPSPPPRMLQLTPPRPSPPPPLPPSYGRRDVGRSVATVKRANNDSVFFFYNTRGEGLVDAFDDAYPNATVLHRIDPTYRPAAAGGVATVAQVSDKVTHFFVLYGGDESAGEWYRRVPRGGFPPYLLATEEVKNAIEPEAKPVTDAVIELELEGRVEKMRMYRKIEVIEL